ncbi:hypothetical protein C8J56DRAFT_1063743 [Mycena floridula]|nr:hypothetical protein C8J56DRAFT_1063743 [Mycena floridula]
MGHPKKYSTDEERRQAQRERQNRHYYRNRLRLCRETKVKYYDRKIASSFNSSTRRALCLDPTDGLPKDLLEMSAEEQLYSIQQAEMKRLRLEELSCEREYQHLSHGADHRDLLPAIIQTALTRADKMAGYVYLTSHLPPMQALLDRLRPTSLELYKRVMTAEHESSQILEAKLYGFMAHIRDTATYCYCGLDALRMAQHNGKLSYQRH